MILIPFTNLIQCELLAEIEAAFKELQASGHEFTASETIDFIEGAIGAAILAKGVEPMKFDLRHTFSPGLYSREIRMPVGALLTSKIHLTEHPFNISKGEVSVVTLDGDGVRVERLKAPYSGITKAGTRRLLFIHSETVWTTYHPTTKTNVAEIEDEIILKHCNPFLDYRGLQLHGVIEPCLLE